MSKYPLFFIFLSLYCYAQGDYKTGYYIDSSGKRENALIKEDDFKRINETGFSLQVRDESGATRLIPVLGLSEFAIGDQTKFVKARVSMSNAPLYGNLSHDPVPVMVDANLMLSVIVEGGAVLYQYFSDDGSKFFYKTEVAQNPVQLLRHAYLDAAGQQREVNTFREQLYDSVRCMDQGIGAFLKIKYETEDLKKQFIHFSECSKSNFSVFAKSTGKKAVLSFAVLASAKSAKLSQKFEGHLIGDNGKVIPSVGFEAEIRSGSGRWAAFIRPSYEKVSIESESFYRISKFGDSYRYFNSEHDFSAINVPIGVRYYFRPGNKHDFFLETALGFQNATGTRTVITHVERNDVILTGVVYTTNVTSGIYLALGGGYKFNSRWAAGIEWNTPKNIIEEFDDEEVKYNTMAFNVLYTFY